MIDDIIEVEAEIVGTIAVAYINGTTGEIGVSRTEKTIALHYTSGEKDTLLIMSYSTAAELVGLLSTALAP